MRAQFAARLFRGGGDFLLGGEHHFLIVFFCGFLDSSSSAVSFFFGVGLHLSNFYIQLAQPISMSDSRRLAS